MDLLPFDTSMFPGLNTVICDDGAIDNALELAKDPKPTQRPPGRSPVLPTFKPALTTLLP